MLGNNAVIISAPSLDAAVNVSGISSVVNELTAALQGKIDYDYIRLGKPQIGSWLRRGVVSLIYFTHAVRTLLYSPALIFHSNTALDVKSICRDLVLIKIAKAVGKRTLLHAHGGRYVHEPAQALIRQLLVMLLKAADRVVFLSGTELKLFEARYPAYVSKMCAIYNSIDLSGIERACAGSHGSDQLLVTFVGRLVEAKGVHVVLGAAQASYPYPVHFSIHGDGPLRDIVEKAAAENPSLTKAEIFPRDKWRDVLSQYDIILLPSVSGEGMPMVILEAMALGVVPITTSIASIPEVVEDGERGILVPCNNVAAVVRAISFFAEDRSRLKRMRDSCRAFARANCDIRVAATKFFDIYRDLISD
jgi:glycosyltransferase involved in cell wall biosynthesis